MGNYNLGKYHFIRRVLFCNKTAIILVTLCLLVGHIGCCLHTMQFTGKDITTVSIIYVSAVFLLIGCYSFDVIAYISKRIMDYVGSRL